MRQEIKEDKQRRNRALLIVGGIVVLLLLVGAGIYIANQSRQLREMEELAALDKELLEEQYESLALQYEGYRFEVENDSLAYQLASEQAKVQRLLEELRTVKSNNAQRIAELTRELETLRQILRNYVIQIDSLNAANQQLRAENKEVREQISKVTTERSQLRQEKEKLEERVTLAAKLSVSSFRVRGLNARGRETSRIHNMKQLELSFQIDPNITAEPGYKDIYVRISKPDDTLLQQPGVSGTFSFEGGTVPYSITRQVEYTGEAVEMRMYWDIQEYLIEGRYRVEFFADGYMIGRHSFSLE